ncbi:MAG: hypothetical protein M3N53_01685 [Actinomycetota bacterium]|nr:hypothetical protein [Actinomycetota bacterium]
MTHQELPIACSLDGSQMGTREQQWKELLGAALVARRAIAGGVELRFDPSPETVSQLRRLIDLENHCCAWIQWAVREEDALVVEAIASRDEGVRLLSQWFGVGTTTS